MLKNKDEILQKEIDWIKFSMDTDKSDHPVFFNTLLQNVATRLVLFLGVLSAINLLMIHYFCFLDALHFILINFSLILIFLVDLKLYESKEKNKPGGINNIEKEFRIKKYMLKRRYKEKAIDLDKIQREFDELKEIFI